MSLRSMRGKQGSRLAIINASPMVNSFFRSRFIDERSGFHGVDTEARYVAAVNAYNNLSLFAIGDIEQCLEAEDYVDRCGCCMNLLRRKTLVVMRAPVARKEN
ncbi:hypothetical protein HanLR1_Chr00c0883g0779321 [Helianthus annuus]|nr:hypothetical protein HanLR1_Chr00c0883g0779321 [Helianthus annuus]